MSDTPILPTYYVRHPDGSYSVADPQPEQRNAGVRECGKCHGEGRVNGEAVCRRCDGTGRDKHDPWCVGGEPDGVCNCGIDGVREVKPAAWLHEFTDPHDGTRRRATWMHKPRDYDLQPGDTVTPLYAAGGVKEGS